MRILAVFVLLAILSACESQNFEIKKIKIITRDAGKLADWYVKNFDFKASADQELLYHKNLTILLEENDKATHHTEVKENFNLDWIPGFHKIGFLTNQFDNLVGHLKNNGVEVIGDVLVDQTLKKRILVVKDPEGNKVQIQEDEGQEKLKPYLISIISEAVGEQEKWYQMKLHVAETYNKDIPEKDVYIRVLRGDNFLIELINTTDRPVRSELNYEDMTGFHSVEIRGARATLEEDHEGNRIICP